MAKISERDAKAVYDFTQLIPDRSKRFSKALNVFEFLGYYFGDEDYKDCTDNILSRIDEWITSAHPSCNICTYVCKFLQNNVLRLGSYKVITYFIRMMSPEFELNVETDAFKIVATNSYRQLVLV